MKIDSLYQKELVYPLIRSFPKIIKKPFLELLSKFRNSRLKKLKTPKVLTFFVTNRCNARCNHCFYWKELNKLKKEEMNLEQIKSFVKSLKHPLLSVLLTGGEPFLREDLVQICQIFSKYNKTAKIIIPTNGCHPELIAKEVKEILNKTNSDLNVIMSVDGFEKTSEEIRGVKNIFERYKETISLLKKINDKRFKISIITTVSNKNYDEVIPLVRFNQENWKLEHKVQYVRSCHEVYGLNPELIEGFSQKDETYAIPSLEKIEKLNKELRKIIKKSSLSLAINHLERETTLEILKKKKKIMNCVAGVYDAVIFPNGNVSMCEFTKPFGNLKESNYNFFKLWISEKAEKIRKQIQNCGCIHSCNLIDSMSHDKDKLIKIFNK